MTPKTRTAAQALVDQLVIHGVRHVFCVPGESYLPVLDALRDAPIALTVCRQEGGAAMMAEAAGRATGEPGVAFVTRGPGATNAAAGVHIARQSSTPMILFVGQVDRSVRGRDAWQELDYAAVFGSMTKWAAEVDDAGRIAEYVSRAFHVASAGEPGPVVLALPHDMLLETAKIADAEPFAPAQASPGTPEMEALQAALSEAVSPLVLLGGSRWSREACEEVARFCERFELPVATGFRRLPLFPALHPNYAGDLGLGANPALVARVKAADLVLAIGARLSEVTTQGYGLFEIPAPRARVVHVFPGPEELGRVWRPYLAIAATPVRFARALSSLTPPASPAWRGSAEGAHADYLAWSQEPTDQPGEVNLAHIMIWLRENLPADAILCNGAGNYTAWIHRFYRVRGFGTHFAPNSGSMGYGVPAGVAIQRLHPERRVVVVTGDGDFLMNGQEFATAVQYESPIIVLVLDNASYGTIRMHQERDYPGRVFATDLKNPDFAAYARAFGGFGATVERTDEFPPAFEAAARSGLPAILHVKFDVDGITPTQTLSGIRAQGLAGAGR
jgi:acetolactate synthase-1/2/3 large subunit